MTTTHTNHTSNLTERQVRHNNNRFFFQQNKKSSNHHHSSENLLENLGIIVSPFVVLLSWLLFQLTWLTHKNHLCGAPWFIRFFWCFIVIIVYFKTQMSACIFNWIDTFSLKKSRKWPLQMYYLLEKIESKDDYKTMDMNKCTWGVIILLRFLNRLMLKKIFCFVLVFYKSFIFLLWTVLRMMMWWCSAPLLWCKVWISNNQNITFWLTFPLCIRLHFYFHVCREQQ